MSLCVIDVDSKIIEIRGAKVLLDSDVAELYGVQTKEINQAVKNNADKFPAGYVISLKDNELRGLRSKFLTLNTEDDSEISGSRSKILTLKGGRGSNIKYPPKAFTEKGLYMLATILKSPLATETTLAIIETFAKIRELTRTVGELAKKTTKEEKEPLMQRGGEIISEILGDSLSVSESETTFKINLAVMSLEHTVKKSKQIPDAVYSDSLM